MSKTDPMWVFENYGAAAELIDELELELEAARKQEPVARVGMVPGTDFKSVDFFPDLQSLPVGATLYMLPPLAGKVSVSDGWRIERSGDRIIVQQLPSGAGYSAARQGESGIAESVLYLLADTLVATPSMEVKS